MKKYPKLTEFKTRRNAEEQLEKLLLFQELLRTYDSLNEQFCGKALDIADGLQPWIDALKCQLNR